MKKFLPALLAPIAVNVALAQDISDQQMLLMAASQKAVDLYREAGVAGMGEAVDACDSSLSRASTEEDIEYCIALNLASMHVDDLTTQAQGLPRDNRFKDNVVFSQAQELLTFFGAIQRSDEIAPYINERNAKIRDYVVSAASTPQAARPAQPSDDETQAIADAFEAFWTSTNCDELKQLTQWNQLLARFQTNDQQLCATFVQMHEQVRGVKVINVQALPGNKAKVTANLMLSQGSMEQKDTFVLENGRWVLAGG